MRWNFFIFDSLRMKPLPLYLRNEKIRKYIGKSFIKKKKKNEWKSSIDVLLCVSPTFELGSSYTIPELCYVLREIPFNGKDEQRVVIPRIVSRSYSTFTIVPFANVTNNIVLAGRRRGTPVAHVGRRKYQVCHFSQRVVKRFSSYTVRERFSRKGKQTSTGY